MKLTNLTEYTAQRLGYPDYTQEFYNCLYIPPEEVWQGSKKNRIKTVPILVVGTTGIGKTTFAENVIKNVSNWYDRPEWGVCPVYTNEARLVSLMEYGLQMFRHLGERWKQLPSVYVLVFDDATAVKVKHEEVRRFFSIRHVAQEHTGINEGIVYSIFLTHDWYSLNKIFRRYGEIAVVLSCPPLDTYARQHLETFLGKTPVHLLQESYRKARKYDAYKGVGFVKFPYKPNGKTEVGYIRFRPVETPYVKIKLWEQKHIEVDRVDLVLHIPDEKEEEKKPDEISAEERLRQLREKANTRLRKHREKRKQEREEDEKGRR